MPKLSIPGVRAAAAAALLLFSAPPLAAQTVLRGELVDEHTGRPISGARVRLLSADSRPLRGTLTDSLGHFSFPVRQAGAYRLHAERIGYRPTLTPHLRLAAGDTLQVEFRLAVNAVLLAPVEIVARSRARANPVLEGFYVRRSSSAAPSISPTSSALCPGCGSRPVAARARATCTWRGVLTGIAPCRSTSMGRSSIAP
jgi:hypothetical protein